MGFPLVFEVFVTSECVCDQKHTIEELATAFNQVPTNRIDNVSLGGNHFLALRSHEPHTFFRSASVSVIHRQQLNRSLKNCFIVCGTVDQYPTHPQTITCGCTSATHTELFRSQSATRNTRSRDARPRVDAPGLWKLLLSPECFRLSRRVHSRRSIRRLRLFCNAFCQTQGTL